MSDNGPCISRLFVTDKPSGRRFLVDTGADISVVPPSFAESKRPPGKFNLFAANGSKIATYGEILMSLDLGLRRKFQWPFVIAAVSHPIIGADFLQKFSLLVDIKNRRLLDSITQLSAVGSIGNATNFGIKLISGNSPFHKLLEQYPNVIRSVTGKPTADHGIVHVIETTGPPIFAKATAVASREIKGCKRRI
ncbi:uncharacterized protein LOC118179965 [Stegodyphus dumicola]|uniref:uncharacterized protein LOC118179965 n=1 Tax=Stegodyphus dumicola TaxID=202533 RepID=UPI0015A83C85|nr:uncharacterized protein LOC118179965 [Stegodyphus dumicola]